MRLSRRPREPPIRHRPLWRRLRDAQVDAIPEVLKEHFSADVFAASVKGELGADLSTWSECFSKCVTWLRRWAEQHSEVVQFASSDDGSAAELLGQESSFAIPDACDRSQSDVRSVLDFQSCLLEYAKLKVSMQTIDELAALLQDGVQAVSALLSSPSPAVVDSALQAVQHLASASQRLQHRHHQSHLRPPLSRPTVMKIVSLAGGWDNQPSPLQYSAVAPDEPVTVTCAFYPSAYRPGEPQPVPEGRLPDWLRREELPTGQVTLSIDVGRATAAGGPNSIRDAFAATVQRESLPPRAALPLWSRLRMAVGLHSSERRQDWARCRMLALAVLAETAETELRQLLQHAADWFQDVTGLLHDRAAPPNVLSAILGLLHALLSGSTAREVLNSADLRGSALSQSRIAASQSRLTEMLTEAPDVLSSPQSLDESGRLREDIEHLYSELSRHAHVFTVSQGRGGNARTVSAAAIDPVVRIPKLRVPGIERVGFRCLGLLEHYLTTDSVREQVLQLGVADAVVDIIAEEVAAVPASEGGSAATAATPGMLPEELVEEMSRRADARQRIPPARALILSQAIRVLTLCTGSQPMKLIESQPLVDALLAILRSPEGFGFAVFKHAVDFLIKLINADHTTCGTVIKAGIMAAVLEVPTRNPPEDPRFVLALPHLLVAFCLNPSGVASVKQAEPFKHLLHALKSDCWYAISVHDAHALGGDLETLVRHVRTLHEDCSSEVAKGLSSAVEAAMEWTGEQADPRPLFMLRNYIYLVEPYLKAAADRVLGRGQAGALLRLTAKLSLYYAEREIPQHMRQLVNELRNDSLVLLSQGAHSAAIREVLDEVKKVLSSPGLVAALPDGDMEEWCNAEAAPLPTLNLVPFDSPGTTNLDAVSAVVHLLGILKGLQGDEKDDVLPQRRYTDRGISSFLGEWASRQGPTLWPTLITMYDTFSTWADAAEPAAAPSGAPAERRTAAEIAPSAVSAALAAASTATVATESRMYRVLTGYTECFRRLVVALRRACTEGSFGSDASRRAGPSLAALVTYMANVSQPATCSDAELRRLHRRLTAPVAGVTDVLFARREDGAPDRAVLRGAVFAALGDRGVRTLVQSCGAAVCRALKEGESASTELSECAVAAARILRSLQAGSDKSRREGTDAPDDVLSQANAGLMLRIIGADAAVVPPPELAVPLFGVVGSLVANSESGEPARTQPRASPDAQAHDDAVDTLVGTGFPRARVVRALQIAGHGNMERAMEWLLSHVTDADEPDEPEEEPGDEEEPEKEPNPVDELLTRLVPWALNVSRGSKSDDVRFCATDVLCQLCEKHAARRIEVLAMLKAAIEGPLEGVAADAPDPIGPIRDIISQTALALCQHPLRSLRIELSKSASFVGLLANDLRSVAKSLRASDPDKRKELEARLAGTVGVLDALTLPPGETTGSPPPAGDGQPAWSILLLSAPADPSSLQEGLAKEIVTAMAGLLDLVLPPDILSQLLVVMARLTKHNSVAVGLLKDGVVPLLLEAKATDDVPLSVSTSYATIFRNIVEDAQYVQSEQETAIVRTHNKITQAAAAGPRSDAVIWIPKPTAAEEKPDPTDRKRKRTPAKGRQIRSPTLGPGQDPDEEGDAKETEQVMVVKLPSLLPELEAQKRRNPESFLKALAATCQFVRRQKSPQDKPSLCVDLRPAAARKSTAGRRCGAAKAAEQLVATLTSHFLQRSLSGAQSKNLLLATPQLLRFVGDIFVRFPSCASPFLAARSPSGGSCVSYLLSSVLPYTAPPDKVQLNHAPQAARFVLHQLALREPAKVCPEIVEHLDAATAVGAVHALNDLIAGLTKGREEGWDPKVGGYDKWGRAPATRNVCAKFLEAGIVASICRCIRRIDLHHPAAADVFASVFKAAAKVVNAAQAAAASSGGPEPAVAESGRAEEAAAEADAEARAAAAAEEVEGDLGDGGDAEVTVHVEVMPQGQDSAGEEEEEEEEMEEAAPEAEQDGGGAVQAEGEEDGGPVGVMIGGEGGDMGGYEFADEEQDVDEEDGDDEDDGEDEEDDEYMMLGGDSWAVHGTRPSAAELGGIGGLMRGILLELRDSQSGETGLQPEAITRMMMGGGLSGIPGFHGDAVRVVQGGRGGGMVYLDGGRGAGLRMPGGRGLTSLNQGPPADPSLLINPPADYRPRSVVLPGAGRGVGGASAQDRDSLFQTYGPPRATRTYEQPTQFKLSYSADVVEEALSAYLESTTEGCLIDMPVKDAPSAPTGSAPNVLTLAADHPCPQVKACAGTYKLVKLESVHGNAVWRQEGGKGLLYCTPGGHWKVTDDRRDFVKGAGYVSSREPHGGKWPDQIVAWRTRSGVAGSGFGFSRVVEEPPKPPPPPKPQAPPPQPPPPQPPAPEPVAVPDVGGFGGDDLELARALALSMEDVVPVPEPSAQPEQAAQTEEAQPAAEGTAGTATLAEQLTRALPPPGAEPASEPAPTEGQLRAILSECIQGSTPAATPAAPPAGSPAPAAAEPAPAAAPAPAAEPAPQQDSEPALDPTFVAALPADLIGEVLRENIQTLMTLAEPQPAPGTEQGSTVHPGFLAPLPQSIRNEVYRIEQGVLRQRAESRAAAAAGPSAGPAEIDPATFIQTLTPDLRQDILATADDDLIRRLPPEIVAEAQAIREVRERQWREQERLVAHMQQGRSRYTGGADPTEHGQIRGTHSDRDMSFGWDLTGLRRARGEKVSPSAVASKDAVAVLEPSALPTLVRVLYLSGFGINRGMMLREQHRELLQAVAAHDDTCRTLCMLFLLVLANGEAKAPPIEGAESCVMTRMTNVPAHIPCTAPAPPLVIPPLVVLRAIETVSKLAETRAAVLSSPGEAAAAVLASGDDAAALQACQDSFLFRLLGLLQARSFTSSPKLGEALARLLQTLVVQLSKCLTERYTACLEKLQRPAIRARRKSMSERMPRHEMEVMHQLDFDGHVSGKESEEEVKKKVAAAAQVRKEVHVRVREDDEKYAAAARMAVKDKLKARQPTPLERFAAILFTHPPTISSLVQVYENTEATDAAVDCCTAALTEMCARGTTLPASALPGSRTITDGVVGELLSAAHRAAGAAADLRSRSALLSAAWKQHLIECGVDPSTASGSPRARGALPSGTKRFFVKGDILRGGAHAELHLQRLTKGLRRIIAHHRAAVHEQGLLHVQADAPAEGSEQDALQGRWRTGDRRAVDIRGTSVRFERADGTTSGDGGLEVLSGGAVRLSGCRLVKRTKNTVCWDDGEVWHRADSEQSVELPFLADFRAAFEPVWKAVEEYLTSVGDIAKMDASFATPPGVERLVEAFFVFHEIDPQPPQKPADRPAHAPGFPARQRSGQAFGMPRNVSNLSLETAAEEDLDPVHAFIVSHRRLLNSLIRGNPSLLYTSLKVLMSHSGYVDFHNKRTWFREQIRKDQESHHRTSVSVKVRRQAIFAESFRQISNRSAKELKGRMRVAFRAEDGIDGGGLTREWFQVLAQDMFNADYALFIPSQEGNTFQPNPNSGVNVEHLSYFRFVGRVIGLAVYNDVMLDAYFTRSFYKYMLDIPVDYVDIQSIDPDYYKNLNWMLSNSIDGIVFNTFSVETEVFGKMTTVELKEGGSDIQVTDENKHEYVKLVAHYRMVKAIESQLREFCKGVFEVVPQHLIRIFAPDELELLICGSRTVDRVDMKANTNYVGYTLSSPQIVWFWQVVDEMTSDEILSFLQFVTGTSKVPLGGFKDLEGMSGKQKFNIHRVGDPLRLPAAHTCFNQLDLPEYDSLETLRDMLHKAVSYGKFGFGFV